jgi:hypothetical protein
MISKISTVIALATAAFVAAGTAALAQTATPDAKPPVKKTMKHHARKSATAPAGDTYLRAAGSEPAPKASK